MMRLVAVVARVRTGISAASRPKPASVGDDGLARLVREQVEQEHHHEHADEDDLRRQGVEVDRRGGEGEQGVHRRSAPGADEGLLDRVDAGGHRRVGDLEDQARDDTEDHDEDEQRRSRPSTLRRDVVDVRSSANSSFGVPNATRWYIQSR